MTNQKKKDDIKALSFEDAMTELDRVVARLESGDVPLEDSIDLYTRGTALKAHCEEKLKAAEARVEKITTDSSGAVVGVEPLDQA